MNPYVCVCVCVCVCARVRVCVSTEMKCESPAGRRRSTNEVISLEQMNVPILITITSINGSLDSRHITCILHMKGNTSVHNGLIRIKYLFLRNWDVSISSVPSPLMTDCE
jgi:hypothetical protein